MSESSDALSVEPGLKWRLKPGNTVEVDVNGIKVLISRDDIWIIQIFTSWRVNKTNGNYVKVCRWVKTEYGSAKEEYSLHRLVVRATSGHEVDHINRNPLDNRRENLRLASRWDQAVNCRRRKRNGTYTSKYRGVTTQIQRNKLNPWKSTVAPKGKTFHLGSFSNEHHAAIAYNIAAKLVYGEFAFQNDVPQNYQKTFETTAQLSAMLDMQKSKQRVGSSQNQREWWR